MSVLKFDSLDFQHMFIMLVSIFILIYWFLIILVIFSNQLLFPKFSKSWTVRHCLFDHISTSGTHFLRKFFWSMKWLFSPHLPLSGRGIQFVYLRNFNGGWRRLFDCSLSSANTYLLWSLCLQITVCRSQRFSAAVADISYLFFWLLSVLYLL